jgi:hypothetical protein
MSNNNFEPIVLVVGLILFRLEGIITQQYQYYRVLSFTEKTAQLKPCFLDGCERIGSLPIRAKLPIFEHTYQVLSAEIKAAHEAAARHQTRCVAARCELKAISDYCSRTGKQTPEQNAKIAELYASFGFK